MAAHDLTDQAAPDNNDAAVLALLRSGDRRGALAELMRVHGRAVYTRALRIVGNAAGSEDVLQQTFLEAYRDLAGFAGRSSLRTWLLGITTHRALDLVRRIRRETGRTSPTDDLAELPAPGEPVEELDALRRVAALEDCLGVLSEESRAALLMRFQADQTYEEMGEVLGEKPKTLQARVVRSLPALRRCLEGKGVG